MYHNTSPSTSKDPDLCRLPVDDPLLMPLSPEVEAAGDGPIPFIFCEYIVSKVTVTVTVSMFNIFRQRNSANLCINT
jgi:hypothetical protein